MADDGDRWDLVDLKKALATTVEEDCGTSAGEKFDRFFDIKVTVSGKGVGDPDDRAENFEEAGLGPRLRSNIRAAGYDRPLPIQQYAIPYITGGFDVIGHSITGSGKTAAYILPIIDMLYAKKDHYDLGHIAPYPPQAVHPRALVLVPTRELAIQVAGEFERFSKGLQIKTKALYGGKDPTNLLMAEVRKGGCDILVATPGRLKDCLCRSHISVVKIKYFVLDEADEMLNECFGPEIQFFVESGMPTKDIRQTLLFSATFPRDIQEIVHNYMQDDFVFISVGRLNSANSDITQDVIKTTADEKMGLLLQILNDRLKDQPDISKSKILIFVRTIAEANSVAARLEADRFPCLIHSEMLQVGREEALNEFRVGSKSILVATSVAARGLDINSLDLVINYSLPKNMGEYVQRIGRTGRVGNKGRTISFYDSKFNHPLGDGLVKVLMEASLTNTDQDVPRWLLEETGRGDGPSYLDELFERQKIERKNYWRMKKEEKKEEKRRTKEEEGGKEKVKKEGGKKKGKKEERKKKMKERLIRQDEAIKNVQCKGP